MERDSVFESSVQVFADKFFECFLFCGWEWVNSSNKWIFLIFQFDL